MSVKNKPKDIKKSAQDECIELMKFASYRLARSMFTRVSDDTIKRLSIEIQLAAFQVVNNYAKGKESK